MLSVLAPLCFTVADENDLGAGRAHDWERFFDSRLKTEGFINTSKEEKRID
jgi:hypothetical protein